MPNVPIPGWCCVCADPFIDEAHEDCFMAHLIAKLGIDALKPQLVGKLWRKPLLSGRKAADLKKHFLAEGKEWPVEEVASGTRLGFGQKKLPKGHKHDKLKLQRNKDIEANLADMPNKIAAYRESRKLKDGSLLDRMTLSPKERRMKQYRLPK